MNRLDERLGALAQEGRKALVAYIVSGDPSPDMTLPAMHALVRAGADVIELGIPFSDPMAEGPVIQRGHERALASNMSLTDSLAVVSRFREQDTRTPIILMGYANPVERMGYAAFAERATAAGVDGVLTVDLPPEEAVETNRLMREAKLHTIFLVAPTSTEQRIRHVAELASGFIYYVSLKGVTGAANINTSEVAGKVAELKAASALPVMVGFGIKDAESAAAVARTADGVVVGSALVTAMGEGGDVESVCARLDAVLSPIRAALDGLANTA